MGMSQVRWGRLGQAEEVRGMAQERVVRGGDISGSSHREEIMGDGGQSGSQKDAVRRGGSSLSVFPLAGGFRPEKQPQGVGVGECGEGDGLALGLRPGSFYSSQN